MQSYKEQLIIDRDELVNKREILLGYIHSEDDGPIDDLGELRREQLVIMHLYRKVLDEIISYS